MLYLLTQNKLKENKMIPTLPEHTLVDGRIMYTKVQLKQYGADCYAAGLAAVVVKNEKPRNAEIEELFKIFGVSK